MITKALTLSLLMSTAVLGADQSDFNSLQMTGIAPKGITVDAEAAAKRLAGGIQFPTISNQDRSDFDEDAFRGYHAYLEKTYPNVHKTMSKELVGAERKFSLLFTWQGSDPSLAPVVLMGHQDVVPIVPETKDKWTYDPFSGTIADGHIWGRGTIDDKVSVHAILEAAELRIKQGFKPKRTIIFAFGHDEEVGGQDGAREVVNMLEKRGIKEIALVLDEGAPSAPGIFPGINEHSALIGIAEKGYVSLELKIVGAGGHSSMPPEHSNIGILAEAITKLEANPFPDKITPALRTQYRYLGPELPKEHHDLYREVAFGDDGKLSEKEKEFIALMKKSPRTNAMLHTTTAVTIMKAGIKANVLPTTATAVVNFRILQGETIDTVIEAVRKTIDDDRIQVTDISQSINPSTVSPVGSGPYKMLETTLRQTWGNKMIVAPLLGVGGTDAKHYAARPFAKNVYRLTPIKLSSAADLGRFHSIDERILVKEFASTISFFHTLIENVQDM